MSQSAPRSARIVATLKQRRRSPATAPAGRIISTSCATGAADAGSPSDRTSA